MRLAPAVLLLAHAIRAPNDVPQGAPRTISPEREAAIGALFAEQLRQHEPVIEDTVVVSYLTRLAGKLAQSGSAQPSARVAVLDTDRLRMPVLPGGYLFIASGLILAAQNEAELAGAVAHAVAHIEGRHMVRLLAQAQASGLTAVPAAEHCWDPWSRSTLRMLTAELAAAALELEIEADRVAIARLDAAGYDASAGAAFIRRLLGNGPGAERRAAAVADALRALPARERSRVDSSDFERARESLEVMSLKRP